MEATGVKLYSALGKIYLIPIYVPPNSSIKLESWTDLMNRVPMKEHLIILGDFNAHLASHRPYKLNDMGKMILEIQDLKYLVLLNEDKPTHTGGQKDLNGNVLDLILASASIAGFMYTETL